MRELLRAADGEKIGAVGAKILRYDAPGTIWFGGGKFDRMKAIGVHPGSICRIQIRAKRRRATLASDVLFCCFRWQLCGKSECFARISLRTAKMLSGGCVRRSTGCGWSMRRPRGYGIGCRRSGRRHPRFRSGFGIGIGGGL